MRKKGDEIRGDNGRDEGKGWISGEEYDKRI
jgi:hypothetical protein